MVRKLTIMAAVLILLGAVCAAEQVVIHRATEETLRQTQEIIRLIKRGELEEAAKKSHALDRAWDEQAKILEVLVNHGPTDDVRYAFSRLIAALEAQDAATAMVYASELEGAVEHVYERQAVTAENIL